MDATPTANRGLESDMEHWGSAGGEHAPHKRARQPGLESDEIKSALGFLVHMPTAPPPK